MRESKNQLKITHVITGLGIGGAENMLYKLVKQHSKRGVQIKVVSLGEMGPIGEKIRTLGISVETVNLRRGAMPSLIELIKLILLIRRSKPEILQGWMYHGNIAVTIGGIFLVPRPRVYWNIRQSLGPLDKEKKLTRRLIRVSSYLSGTPTAILYNSMESAEQHEKIGYSPKRRHFIPNGFDLNEFRPSYTRRQQVRRELGVSDDAFLVGHVARFHPKKDHTSYFAAARSVLDKRSDVFFLAIGRGVVRENPILWQYIEEFKLENSIFLLGERGDVSSIYCALDLFVSSSAWGEGFPNNIGEAMATGLCCAATDVGESKRLLGETGKVTAAGDSEALATEILELAAESTSIIRKKGQEARNRVSQWYSIEDIGSEYLDLYTENNEPKSTGI